MTLNQEDSVERGSSLKEENTSFSFRCFDHVLGPLLRRGKESFNKSMATMGPGQMSSWVLGGCIIKSLSELTLAPDRSSIKDGLENHHWSCVTVGRGFSQALSQPGVIRSVHGCSWR